MKISFCKPQSERWFTRRKLWFPAHFLLTRSRYVRLRPLVDSALDSPSPPQVKYVPEWFPGAGFKTLAREGGVLFTLAVDGPLAYVKRSLEVSRYLKSLSRFFRARADFCGISLMGTKLLLHRSAPIVWLSFRIKGLMKALFDR